MEQTFSQKLSFCHWGNWIWEEKWLTQGGSPDPRVDSLFSLLRIGAERAPAWQIHTWPLLTWDLRYRLNFFDLFVHLPLPWPRAMSIRSVILKKVVVSQHNGKGKKKTTYQTFLPYIIQISNVLILPNAMATYISAFQFLKGILGIIGSCPPERFRLSAIEMHGVASSFCVRASIQAENKSSPFLGCNIFYEPWLFLKQSHLDWNENSAAS